jgi:hypothetical protein
VELSFNGRLAMLVDQQRNWRENEARSRRVKAAELRGNSCREDIEFCASHENLFTDRPVSLRASLLRRWRRRPAGMGTRCSYARVQSLFRDPAIARADGRLPNRLPIVRERHSSTDTPARDRKTRMNLSCL